MKTKVFGLTVMVAAFLNSSLAASYKYIPDQWERQIIAACLILEASDQGEKGMIAVANVMNNRAGGVARRIYRIVKKPYAFSSLNAATTGKTGTRGYADHVTRASRDTNWKLALEITDQLFAGTLSDLTNGATHYTLKGEFTSWMAQMRLTAVIGSHKFLR